MHRERALHETVDLKKHKTDRLREEEEKERRTQEFDRSNIKKIKRNKKKLLQSMEFFYFDPSKIFFLINKGNLQNHISKIFNDTSEL